MRRRPSSRRALARGAGGVERGAIPRGAQHPPNRRDDAVSWNDFVQDPSQPALPCLLMKEVSF
jgi:hypothetical protein